MKDNFHIFDKNVQDLISNVIAPGIKIIKENEDGWVECKFELTPYDLQFFIECTCDNVIYKCLPIGDFDISNIFEENFTNILNELANSNIIGEFWHKDEYGDFQIDNALEIDVLDDIFQKFHYYQKDDREKFFKKNKYLFANILGTYTFSLNIKKWNALLDIVFVKKPQYLLTLRNTNKLLDQILKTNYTVEEMEDILRIGDEYLFDKENYIKCILCSTPEKIAKFLDLVYDVIKNTGLIENIEKYETKVTTKEGKHYKSQKHKNNYGIFYYEGESTDNKIECIGDEIETPFWKYNFKTKLLTIDNKYITFKGVQQYLVLEKAINADAICIEVTEGEVNNFKNITRKLRDNKVSEEFIKLFYTFQKDKKHYIGTLRKQ